MSQIVLSGIRATGRLHLGNYLGAMVNFIRLQETPDTSCFIFVADYHTLTTAPNPDDLRRHLPQIVAGYLAVGLDPERTTLYAQSSVPELAELAQLLAMVTPVQELLRLPTYKEKAEKQPENVNFGLLGYPVLMAADILGPKATLIPVGKDQLKHVELAREIARRFNARYGDVFPLPVATVEEAITVPGLDGSGKMGKSEGNTIDLLDAGAELWEKIRVAVTDPQRARREDPGRPEVCNVYTLHTLMAEGQQLRGIHQGCTTASIGCIDCKKILAQTIDELLSTYQERIRDIKMDDVMEVLHKGGKRARKIISETVAQVRENMGLLPLSA